MELAIDTSTRYASVALARQGEVVGEQTWWSEQNHTVELLSTVDEMFKKTQTSVKDLTGIIVAKGPGNFSALRVGVSLAKGLAMGLGIPTVGVNTLLVEAFPYLGQGMPVYAALDAGRGELVWASFLGGIEPCQTSSERVTDLETLSSHLIPPAILCGEGISQRAQELQEQRREGVVIAAIAPPTRRAGVLAHLGAKRLLAGDADELTTLHPIYMRGPSITSPKRP